MSIVALKVEKTEDLDWGRYTITSERMIALAHQFEDIAAGDDADRDEIGNDNDFYSNWLEGRAAGYRHAAQCLRRQVDIFSHKER